MARLRAWLPILLCAAVISSLSTESFSSQHTGQVVLGLLRRLLPFASAATLDLLHLFVRKSAHFTEYFIFSLLLLRGVRFEERRGQSRNWQLRWAIWAVAIAAAYAGFDELHQHFVPGREASPWDALLDTAGAVAAQILAWGIARRWPLRKEAVFWEMK